MILSIYFGFHDSCVTLATQEKILLHLEAERYFRKKHIRTSALEMNELIEVALRHVNTSIEDIEEVLLAEWLSEYDLNEVLIQEKKFKPVITSHHKNHVGTTLPSGSTDFLAVVADGGSEDGSTKFYHYKDRGMKLVADYGNEIITGKFYGTLTQLVIHPNPALAHQMYPGKLMGLTALGNWDQAIADLIFENADSLNMLHTKDTLDIVSEDSPILKTISLDDSSELRNKFNITDNYTEYWNDQRRCNLAHTGQKIWVSRFMELIEKHRHISKTIALSGGCALNLDLIAEIERSGWFSKVYVSPISNDSGQSLGAIVSRYPSVECAYPFLGRSFGEVSDFDVSQLLKDLLDKKIIAWFEGAAEIGPRALGHRSFIGLPDSDGMKFKLSVKIKGREKFRPIASIIPEEIADKWFLTHGKSPYMTTSWRAKESTKKLAPAIVHYDGTSRVQTISRETNQVLYDVLMELSNHGHPPILMNTSFNIAGEPNVDTPEDAKRTFEASGADVMYLNGKRFIK